MPIVKTSTRLRRVDLPEILWCLAAILVFIILSFQRASISVWTIGFGAFLLLYMGLSTVHISIKLIIWLVFLLIITILNCKYLRRHFISKYLLIIYKKSMPKISVTEREALEAGTVGWERTLFSGMPDWQALNAMPEPTLSAEEKAFIEGPVKELCAMLDDWEITHTEMKVPDHIWTFLKSNGFFSLIIPKKYGGKDFSAFAHSEILTMVYASSITVGSTVAVPNSLGPAELLLKYGTDQQKEYYLPRLASGEEIPCFALTSPLAGSDASSIPDRGIICEGEYKGRKIIGIKVTWDKRYITLAPIATLLGIAFKLFDPDHLLSEQEEIGITCALIPTTYPGVQIGERHFPLNIPFQNGPTQGKDVFIPLDFIIGGVEMAGKGWSMLLECLSVGRAITLPASATAAAKLSAFSTGAYARIREQFGFPIGEFEGVQEVLARILGQTYMIEAGRRLVLDAIENGEKPTVPSAIIKYHTTELARIILNDAMDIHGGKGVCLGPKNYIGRNYQAIPIMITVEGANILTRCMIIFGQGLIRCHPYILNTLHAAQRKNKKQALQEFDENIFQHFGMVMSNVFRTLCLGLTAGKIAQVPEGPGRVYYQQFMRFSAAFAMLADVFVVVFAGQLKRKEKLSGRMGDIFSMLYLGSAVLKHFNDCGQPEEDLPIVHWACQQIVHTIRGRINNILRNLKNRPLALLLRFLIYPWGFHTSPPKDDLDHQLAKMMMTNSESVRRVTHGIYTDMSERNMLGLLKQCLTQVLALAPLEDKLKKAYRHGKVVGLTFEERITSAVAKKVISQNEADQLLEMHALRLQVIAVDAFDPLTL